MTTHTKAARRASFRGYALRAMNSVTPHTLRAAGWEVMSWTPEREMTFAKITLAPDAWARFCELAGIDAATGAPLPEPLPAPVCPAPTTEGSC